MVTWINKLTNTRHLSMWPPPPCLTPSPQTRCPMHLVSHPSFLESIVVLTWALHLHHCRTIFDSRGTWRKCPNLFCTVAWNQWARLLKTKWSLDGIMQWTNEEQLILSDNRLNNNPNSDYFTATSRSDNYLSNMVFGAIDNSCVSEEVPITD